MVEISLCTVNTAVLPDHVQNLELFVPSYGNLYLAVKPKQYGIDWIECPKRLL